ALEHLGNPDVRLGQISLLEGQDGNHQVSVTVFNRGLSDIVAPVTLTFFNGKPEEGEVLGTVGVESLKSNVSQRASIQVADEALTDDVHITMTVDPSVEECQIENNKTQAALVRVQTTDPGDLFDTQVYLLNVEDVNEPPLITSNPVTELQGGQQFNYQLKTIDGDVGDAHIFTLVSAPAGLYLDPRTGKFSSDPSKLAPGEYQVVVRVEDLRGGVTEQTFVLKIHQNLPPQIISPAQISGLENSGYRYEVEATDPNVGDLLSFALEQAPAGMQIERASGLIE